MHAHVSATNRRSFLAKTVALAGGGIYSVGSIRAQAASANVAMIAPNADDLMRVRIEVDVKGNVKVAENPLVSNDTQKSFPITSKATLDYEERALRPLQADRKSEIVASERYYHTATSRSLLNKTTSEQSLRDSVRHTIVRRETLPESIYTDTDFFTHEELSLLKSPVSSVSVDRLLPSESVSTGDKYEIAGDALCSVLNLSSVDKGAIESLVTDVKPDAVRFKLEGEIEASVEGVDTKLRLVGKMTYDRSLKTCTWLALAIHETRQIGKAEPGFDISATIRMIRKPMSAPVALDAQPTKIAFDQRIPAERLYVELRSQNLRVGTMMDRSWRMIQDAPGSAVMRMIRHDQSIAQCNLRPLVSLPTGNQWTLEAFERDVRTTLGDDLGQLIEGDQRVSAQGLRVLRIVASGETQGVPIRWVILHFSDDAGRRLQATFTLSGDQVTAFAGHDSQFVDALRFLAPIDISPTDSIPADHTGGPESSAAASNGQPETQPNARIAQQSDESSASDRR